jgi:hypothetical protein
MPLDDFDFSEKRKSSVQISSFVPPQAPSNLPDSLSELDSNAALLEQYTAAVELRDSILYDDEIPANQKSQVINSCQAVLAAIIKLQTELHNSERMKRMERTLLSVLKRHPDLQEEFMQDYEEALRNG